jgi:indole-3-glycerol phosphate synthase
MADGSVPPPGDFLATMIDQARARVATARRLRPLARPQRAAAPGRLAGALAAGARGGTLALIAEVKRGSPSRGVIAPDLDAVALARAYEAAGADAVSVLTEPTRFGGSLDDLEAVAAAVRLPVLRKDFVVDAYQVWEAAAVGAAGVLLIAAALPGGALTTLLDECRFCGLDALVEVHDEPDLAAALAAGATLVGVNNRDLRTLAVDRAVTARLAPLVPGGVLLVSESGIRDAADAGFAARVGSRALLVGEALVRAPRERLESLVAELKGEVP